ncbi:MAG: hypothetical protein PVI57_10480 [Gemmatimonadota bacterium]|jgi:hypothetical protein
MRISPPLLLVWFAFAGARAVPAGRTPAMVAATSTEIGRVPSPSRFLQAGDASPFEHPVQTATLVAASDHLALHSDPWINLHHFLYNWARADEGLGTGREHVPVPERASLGELGEEERAAWTTAVRLYRDSVAARNRFADGMLELKEGLVRLGGDTGASPPEVIPGVSGALAVAMPVYLERWWPGHDRANRAWVSSVVDRLRRHESEYVSLTERIYGARWPAGRRRVDVSAYANFAAGYTALGHVVIYSTDPGNQGLYALETLLHEIQHTREMSSVVRGELAEAFEAVGSDVPRNLWHAMIFATAGEFVRIVAEEEGLPPHTPYWTRGGFGDLGGWAEVVPAANRRWLPVVRGEASRGDALAALAADLGGD